MSPHGRISILLDAQRAFQGHGSLHVRGEFPAEIMDSIHISLRVDLRQHPPRGWPRLPWYDLSEAVATWAIGASQDPTGNLEGSKLRLFLVDDQDRMKKGPWVDLRRIPPELWHLYTAALRHESWLEDEGADLRRVTMLGLEVCVAPPTRKLEFHLDSFALSLPAWPFRGISYTAWSPQEYALPSSDASLEQLSLTGANYVALVVTGYMDRADSTKIYLDPVRTPSDESLIHAITKAHALGLRVLLKPHVDCKDGTWRGAIKPANAEAWFVSYTEFITHYAQLSNQHRVELLCVGTEFRSLSGPGYLGYWENVIQAIRMVYPGPLTYAANWDEYNHVCFWDHVDFVGIDAYFPLSHARTPSVDELTKAWSFWLMGLENWQVQVGKPVIFTEIGYRSVDFTAREPWDWQRRGTYNALAQSHAYEAAFAALEGRPWLWGVFWWNWLPHPYAGGYGNTDYTPQNKPAQEVLKREFDKRAQVLTGCVREISALPLHVLQTANKQGLPRPCGFSERG